MLFRLIDKYSLFNQGFFEGFEFTDNLEGFCQVSLLAVFNLLRGVYMYEYREQNQLLYLQDKSPFYQTLKEQICQHIGRLATFWR